MVFPTLEASAGWILYDLLKSQGFLLTIANKRWLVNSRDYHPFTNKNTMIDHILKCPPIQQPREVKDIEGGQLRLIRKPRWTNCLTWFGRERFHERPIFRRHGVSSERPETYLVHVANGGLPDAPVQCPTGCQWNQLVTMCNGYTNAFKQFRSKPSLFAQVYVHLCL
jgi:hypothetical protein